MPKYTYKFCDGSVSEVEVSDEHYAILKKLDEQERENDRRHRRQNGTPPKNYMQVGVTALRTPTGKYYPPVPLYVEIDKLNESGLAPCEEKMLTDYSGLMSEEYAKRLAEEKGTDENDGDI